MSLKEKRVSKQLTKAGYILCRTRAQHGADPPDGYMIVDAVTYAIIAGPRFDLTLDDAAAYVDYYKPQKAAIANFML